MGNEMWWCWPKSFSINFISPLLLILIFLLTGWFFTLVNLFPLPSFSTSIIISFPLSSLTSASLPTFSRSSPLISRLITFGKKLSGIIHSHTLWLHAWGSSSLRKLKEQKMWEESKEDFLLFFSHFSRPDFCQGGWCVREESEQFPPGYHENSCWRLQYFFLIVLLIYFSNFCFSSCLPHACRLISY